MKKLPLLFAAFLVVSASGLRAGEPSDIHTLLRRLDGLLDRREEFLLRHEARLDSLKSLLRGDTLGFGARYAVTAEIAERYFAYQSDSTIAYLRRNVALAERAGNADLTIRAKSVMAMCYSMNGRFLEADRVLAGVTDTLHMSRATQAAYYAAQHRQNRECRSQSEPGAERDRFRACEEYYARRALETTGDISKRFYFAYLVAVDEGDYDRAAAACDSALACAPPVSHDYARAAFYRSETERFRGDEAARFEWLVRAAMADVQGAVRDYGALGGVAEELLRRGDAARAMRCIRVAINDTQAYNSPIRSWRDMAILPQIEQAYSERNARLRAMYVALILLAFLFALSAIGGVLFVLRQNRRLNAVQQTLRESNGKLAELAASLRETNADLSRQNIRIADANRIKEVYIGGFLKTISEYIYKLADTYRHVGRMLRDGRSDALRREYAGTPSWGFSPRSSGSSTACSPTMRASGSAVREASRPNCASSRWSGWASPTRRPSPHCCTVRSIRCTATVRACGCVRSFRSGISNSGCSPSVSGTMPRSFPEPDRNGASCRRNTEFFRSGCTLRRGNAYICSSHIPIR